MDLKIGEFSELTGISVYTLRYYEDLGILKPKRDKGNRRTYSDRDLSWVDFIKRLKATGMPIKEIVRYSELREKGDETIGKRLEMLRDHKEHIRRDIEVLKENERSLDQKIKVYEGMLEEIESTDK